MPRCPVRAREQNKALSQSPPIMVEWEYKIVTGKLVDITDDQLNKLGAEGWEAVGCGVAGRELGPDKMMVLFKRQK